MRRLAGWANVPVPTQFVLLLLLVAMLLAPAGCRRRKRPVQMTDQTLTASMVSAGDPRAAVQFRKGFYEIEANAWRWTAKHFQVALSPPRNAAVNGAQLTLRFTLPEVEMQSLKSITVSAAINDLKLAPQTFDRVGENSYTRDIPADRLRAEMILVDFDVDKSIGPTGADARELAIIVNQVGFVAK